MGRTTYKFGSPYYTKRMGLGKNHKKYDEYKLHHSKFTRPNYTQGINALERHNSKVIIEDNLLTQYENDNLGQNINDQIVEITLQDGIKIVNPKLDINEDMQIVLLRGEIIGSESLGFVEDIPEDDTLVDE